MTAHELALLLAVAGGAVCAALAIEPAARALGVPTPLAFLLGGLVLGELWDGPQPAARSGDIAVLGTSRSSSSSGRWSCTPRCALSGARARRRCSRRRAGSRGRADPARGAA